MRKLISFSIIVICCGIYYASNSAKITEKYTDFRERGMLLGSDKIGYGGLYGMCYLSDYRQPFFYDIKESDDTLVKNINLYLFCDSYLYYRVTPKHFSYNDKLYKMKWFETETFLSQESLDTTKKNVLVFEMTERYVRSLLDSYEGATNMLKFEKEQNENLKQQENTNSKSLIDKFQEPFINPNINSNLELNLFDYKLFRPLKELKANLNFHIFNRVYDGVFVDTAKQQLYYKPTVEGEQKMNAFYPLDSGEISTLIDNINKLNDFYHSKGFDEIYLAIIPNPVTMINPSLGHYNNLIPLLNSNDSLRMNLIDSYSLFKQNPTLFYSKSDSHWNSIGLQRWLDEFNRKLKLLSQQNKVPS
ncbi:MAG: hypothetical protein K9I36_07555 [Bacteroidia bacterium]|nr:hypothetical protein [Bacteroidia bacterium]MCF8426571.1 hypothetical protein [Bacteroidia bacterium]